ncbi:type I site-specific restriction-modification system R (restriction) subunit [Duganella sp. HSC-15S17]|uniref:Type I site-specific restriction-modification system R (Restriction) subunit n=1 Tax=Duganella violaceipulchra TaxID=2849652 RepID=A0ABT1GH52_9BURK|nr:type I site-specific restriction-modification system R (restriction) subunit [Duganella violaceicalia]
MRGFLRPDLFLDYVRHFVLFEQDGGTIIKKIAGYHQFHAVREAVRATVIAARDADKSVLAVHEERATYGKDVKPGSRKAGVVWHTQGSGKSITMACYADKLLQQPEMKNSTLVVVTDRNDLDGQLFATFSAASDLLKTAPVQAGDRDELREMLASREAAGIIFTTAQKFALLDGEETHPLLSGRTNIVVISDEAHRSQYGTKGRLDTKTGKYVFGYAKHLRDALKNATFIGFTGTPIALEDKDILGLEDGKTHFLDTMAAVAKAFSLCGTLDEAGLLRKEIAFFSPIKAAIAKFTTVDKKRSDAEKNSVLKQILDNAITSDGVMDVFALAGLDKPNIGLLSDQFLEDVRQMKSRNLAVELLEKLLRDEIRARARHNVVQEKKYGDRLMETLRKYHNRAIETAQVIKELIQMAKEFQATLEREAALGLSHDEIAFYDALANNENAVRMLGDEVLKKIAIEITEKLRASTTVNWQVRESVRAKLRILVRRCLQKWKYPPDQQPNAVELVLKQAEELSNSWTI